MKIIALFVLFLLAIAKTDGAIKRYLQEADDNLYGELDTKTNQEVPDQNTTSDSTDMNTLNDNAVQESSGDSDQEEHPDQPHMDEFDQNEDHQHIPEFDYDNEPSETPEFDDRGEWAVNKKQDNESEGNMDVSDQTQNDETQADSQELVKEEEQGQDDKPDVNAAQQGRYPKHRWTKDERDNQKENKPSRRVNTLGENLGRVSRGRMNPNHRIRNTNGVRINGGRSGVHRRDSAHRNPRSYY